MQITQSIVVFTFLLSSSIAAQSPTAAPTATANATTSAAPTENSWPRVFNSNGNAVTVYPPTISSWDTRTITGTCAFSQSASDGSALTYGTFSFTAATEVNRLNRMVALSNLTITGVSLPDNPASQAAMQSKMQSMAQAKSGSSINVSLDRLEAAVPTMSTSPRVNTAPLVNSVPRITIATTPTILVPVQGQPVMKLLPGTKLQRVINTQMLLVQDASQKWWLKVADGWMSATTLDGPWSVGSASGNADLATAIMWAATQPTINLLAGSTTVGGSSPSLSSATPAILVSTTPSEVIVTEGAPKWEALGTSGVEYVTNTGGNIFRLTSTGANYVLISGRWFTSATFAGPWVYVAPASIPDQFHAIPQDSAKENILASVPGTPQAQEASIANAIPQMARVPKSQKFTAPTIVGGKPVMSKISGTTLQVVQNCTTPIFMITATEWFALKDGVWFTATGVTGPWTVATFVSPEIYSIPASSPYYYVTFVRVYSTQSDYVLMGYTPGYYGAYEEDGVIVYGTGYWYDPYYYDNVWIPAPVTYGYAVNPAYNPWMGWGMGYGMGMAMSDTYYYNSYPYWGPYSAAYGPNGYAAWGPGGWAATTGNVYQHWGDVSTMSRSSAGYNAWTGNAWGATTATAYNSTTGARAAGQKGYVDNAYTGQWSEGARAAGYNPTTGNYAAGKVGAVGVNGQTTAVAGAGTVGNTATGNEVSAAGVKTENGTWGVAHSDNGTAVATGNNVYATGDGNVYKDNNGTWQSYSGGSWNNVTDPNTKSQLNQQQATRNDGDWRSSMSGRWQQGGDGFGGSQNATSNANSAQNANNNRSNAWNSNSNRSGGNSWGGGGGNQGNANSGRFGRGGGGGGGGGRR
ncbi:MAG: autotransporter [Planctomycetota bacterium]|nr:autotransporter [Planctomycetota bacterium]